ncbi:MAG: hypothetical protein FWC92_11225, partial [Defluviitaleaceae bacterium]|nr:hypothetical protein [Defluviitaleaceae bacterium]
HRLLPQSRIPLQFGSGMALFPEGHFQESVGFAPDIWVSGDALTAALGLIENHFAHPSFVLYP